MTLGLLAAAAVILLCVFFNRISNQAGIPMLLAFILLGMIFGTDGILKIEFENYAFSEQVCSIALIFIMFTGGFGTNWSEARPVAVKAVLLSTVGVVMTAAFTGGFCYFVLHMELLESLLIGSVISSTDAASVFSILRSRKMGLKYRTASLLEVESGSNDPCSYMLTAAVLAAMGGSADAGSLLLMVALQVAVGIPAGALIAKGAAYVLRRTGLFTDGFDMAFVIGIAILSYAVPTLAGGNGYLSAYITGIILGNVKIKNKKALVHFFDGVTGLMQMLLFFLLGLLASPSRIPAIFPTALAIFLFLTFAARPLAVFGIMLPFKCRIKQQLLVSFAGLRGAASIVFAIMAAVNQPELGQDVYHIIFCIVLLSIAFQGTFLSPAAKRLGMSDKDADVMKTFSDYSEETDLQFITITVTARHPWLGKQIRETVLPPDTLIAVVVRDGKNLIPDGNTVLEEKDTVVLSARKFQGNITLALTEQKIEADSKWVGKRILDFSPKSGELVIIILRGDKTVIPRGDTLIRAGDVLVLNSAPGRGQAKEKAAG